MSLNLTYPSSLIGPVVIGDTTTVSFGSSDTPPQITIATNLAGDDVPIAAALEIKSTNGAVVVPRMTTVQMNALDPVVNGSLIFDITTGLLMLYEGGSWLEVATGPAVQFFAWNEVVGPTNMQADNGYWVTAAGLTLMTLPAICPKDAVIKVARMGAGDFRIAQNAGQQVRFDGLTTTLGVAGHIDSQTIGNLITIVCRVANTSFVVESSIGNFDVV